MNAPIEIIPAIDLMEGHCVRLTQGRKDSKVIYSRDPVAVAREWEQAGAGRLHIVDLDGAFDGLPRNKYLIEKIRNAVSMTIQLGGGIRTPEDIGDYLSLGINYVILGTRAFQDPQWLKQEILNHGSRIIVGLDAKDGLVASHGWTVTETMAAASFALDLEEMGLESLIYTDVKRDGMLTGPNIPALVTLAQTVSLNIIASGGIHTIEDIHKIREIGLKNIIGIITGKALYEKTLNLQEAMRVVSAPSNNP